MAERTCTIEGCDRPHRARGWCNAHYWQWSKRGDPLAAVKAAAHRKLMTTWAEASARLYLLPSCPSCSTTTIRQGCCSDRCRADLKQKHRRKWDDQRRERYVPKPKTERYCAWCSAAFLTHSPTRSRYCGAACANRAERHRRARGAGKWKRSELQYRRIAARDGWRCQLCGERVDGRVKYPSPLQGTLDHIVPRSRGGSDDDVNLQLAHHACNSMKSDGAWQGGEQLLIV